MARDWDWTWEHYRELTPEQRAEISAEIAAESIRVGQEFRKALEYATAEMTKFANAVNAAMPRDQAVKG